ncbi:vacuolar ATP synthase subunit c, putative [Eimeria tenella]|uniref:V-type proton ATPase subunit C n=1 Tax=Eimeria tenella TaxID=5802 RepID=U6L1T2_EIMTE|nr:vacuolar ATP synthase subunit c, putative [Eimeria tenella]CDJ41725.1 vacuolar ATP synthase subunit c, putative [Eimeria tenella]|eukprot:XP_013232475.1 vacuolar ATP synthase subunit c, putative [Eimeria tenella]
MCRAPSVGSGCGRRGLGLGSGVCAVRVGVGSRSGRQRRRTCGAWGAGGFARSLLAGEAARRPPPAAAAPPQQQQQQQQAMSGAGEAKNGRRGARPPFWLVASTLRESQTVELVHSKIRNTLLGARAPLCDDVGLFDVPTGLKFGSFDDLIRAVDALQRQDAAVEAALRRVERQALELDPEAQLKVVWQRHSLSVEQYIRRFTWDEAKFPKARAIRENLEAIVQAVAKLEEEVRAKVAVWQEVRQQTTGPAGREPLVYAQRELLDLLTPAVVQPGDFVDSEHLTTAVACVPLQAEPEWLRCYEKLSPLVVPRSAKKFAVPPDKEGVCLWRVVLFKKGLEAFKSAAKERGFAVREFVYSEHVYLRVAEHRSRAIAEQTKHESFLSRVCFAAFSDIFVSWLHLKAMRVFCDAVLRFGVPANFVALFLRPLDPAKEPKIHKELHALLTPPGLFGNRFYAKDTSEPTDNEDFYPYVLITLQPFAA